MLFDIANNLLLYFALRTDLVIEVVAIERRFEDVGIQHIEVFLDVVLHLWCCGSGKSDDRNRRNFFEDFAQTAVFRTEVVAPFGNTVRFVNGKKRNGNSGQKINVFFFGE